MIGFGLLAPLAAAQTADEVNVWPFSVTQIGPSGAAESWSGLGPFLFKYTLNPAAPVPSAALRHAGGEQPAQPGDEVSGFRPLYVQRHLPDGTLAEVTVLYPLYYWRDYGDYYKWSIFSLINRYNRKAGLGPDVNPEGRTLDIWPFYFSRQGPDAQSSYEGFFPIAGSIQGFLGYDRVQWVLFPLWGQSEKANATTTYTPWPIIRNITGAEHGFAVWPLFGHVERPGVFTRKYFLWPLTWNNTIQPSDDKPPGTPPKREVGFLPFYTAEHGPDIVSENYLWPFFGYTDRVAPYRYHETRYFWPFLVQGRGDNLYVNRTGPFYTHSIRKGVDKTWVMWPLWRRMTWTDEDLVQTKTQFFYFLYFDAEQRSASNPGIPPARKTFFWPFCSIWDNGAGRRQFQAPGLFDVFFPDNENIRESWTPLTVLIRHSETPDGAARTSLLWNAVTWQRAPGEGGSQFHLGPLLEVERKPEGRRIALGSGLIGLKRSPGGGWHLFCMEFSRRPDKKTSLAQ